MHVIAQAIGSNQGVRTLVTKNLSTTRFIASTLDAYTSIIRCYPHYVTAMYEYGGMKHNTEDDYSDDEYMVAGKDFAIDLVIMSDVLAQLVNLMISAQDLQLPCWKIIPNGNEVVQNLKKWL